jgi:PAS domain S-box-containing protein
MNLRNRSLLILGLIFFAFFLIIAVVSLSVTLSGLDRIEYQDMGKSMNQTESALNAESVSLLITTHDWAWWDDMADFTSDHNTGFLERNANPDAMATLGIHLMIIMDNDGNLLFNRTLSQDFGTDAPVPEDLLQIIRSNPRLTHYHEGDTGVSGILLSSGGPIIVSSAPVLRSDKSGPVTGTVLMGRYLQPDPLRRISEITGYHITLDWPEKAGPRNIPSAAEEQLESGSNLVLVADNESTITGFRIVPDIAGRDIFLGVSTGRDLYRTGLANIYAYVGLLALWAVITGIIVVIVMDRTVLQRMGRLTEHVRSLSDNRGGVPAPVLSGNDELAELEKTIIASRKDLFIREQQMRVFVNAISSPVALFSLEGTILLANPAFAEYLHRRSDEITGADIRSFLPEDELQKYDHYVQEAIRKKEIVHFENEIGEKTLLMSYYPVLGNDGGVIQLGLLSFDISERKRLENALQKMTKKISLLNTVIFTDIQNKVFVQMGYLELARHAATDPRIISYLEKEGIVVKEIQSSLSFARQFNDMGMNPPRWQKVEDVILFAISHLDLGSISRDFRLEGIEIYADSLLERVFVTLVENTIMYAAGATIIRAGYSIQGDDAVIVVEDDGPGIPEEKKEEIFSKGIGAGGSTSLFLSREILSTTGITLRENGVAGKGARFEIRVPKGSYRLSARPAD